MLTVLTIFHLLVAVILILFVLIQDSKGDSMSMLGGGGGGGSNTLFGASGATNFLVKATRWIAIIFSITCIFLTWNTNRSQTSLIDNYVPEASVPAMSAPAATETTNATETKTEDAAAPSATEESKTDK